MFVSIVTVSRERRTVAEQAGMLSAALDKHCLSSCLQNDGNTIDSVELLWGFNKLCNYIK